MHVVGTINWIQAKVCLDLTRGVWAQTKHHSISAIALLRKKYADGFYAVKCLYLLLKEKKLLTNMVPSSRWLVPFLQTCTSNSLWVLNTTKHVLQHKKGKFSGNNCISSFSPVESSDMVYDPLLMSSVVVSVRTVWVCKQAVNHCNC